MDRLENAFLGAGTAWNDDLSFQYGVGQALYLEETDTAENRYDAYFYYGADPVLQNLTFGGQDFYGFTHKDYGIDLIHDLYVLGKDSNNPGKKLTSKSMESCMGEDDVPQTPKTLRYQIWAES